MSVTHTYSAAWESATPQLSILVPFYHDNPVALLTALDAQIGPNCEILLYDDGSQDPALTAEVTTAISTLSNSGCVITNASNQGRSQARNHLQQAARGAWVLFLDADMRPARADFIANYMALIAQSTADIIFGGFEVEAVTDPDRDLHRALSEVSDCLTLAERAKAGPQFVASSNLCVRKSVLDVEGFDDGFTGWGWEDSEWAARVAKRFTLLHADNPAVHLGLETTDTLLHRFATSGPNYLRFTQKHPDIAPTLALFRISQKLRRIPAQKVMRPVLKRLVKTHFVPMRLRLNALKLWRASHYAEVMP